VRARSLLNKNEMDLKVFAQNSRVPLTQKLSELPNISTCAHCYCRDVFVQLDFLLNFSEKRYDAFRN
jgi:hypothetical protein